MAMVAAFFAGVVSRCVGLLMGRGADRLSGHIPLDPTAAIGLRQSPNERKKKVFFLVFGLSTVFRHSLWMKIKGKEGAKTGGSGVVKV